VIAMRVKMPIESRFVEHLADHLNAEVVLGTVTDVSEAIRWYRMCAHACAVC
jgi:hypothetical protein